MNCQNKSNGRVHITGPNNDTPFHLALYDKIPPKQSSSFRDAMNGNWEDSHLSRAYFSKENVQILQNGIRAGVYNKSNGKYLIGPQDEDVLKIIMRSIFLQHSANLPNKIKEQIRELNKLVIDYAVPQVYGESEGYIKYKQDASEMYIPLSLPTSSDFKHTSLQLKKWF